MHALKVACDMIDLNITERPGPDGPIYLTESAMRELYRDFGKILEGSE